MAEVEGQRHNKECSESSGATCICECRGRMHGMRATRTAKLRRMGEVKVTATRGDTAPDTAAGRRNNPVTLTTAGGAKVTDVHVDDHGVITGSRAARLRDQQTARIRASKREPVQDLSPDAGPGATIGQEEAFRRMHGDVAGDAKFGKRAARLRDEQDARIRASKSVTKGPATPNRAAGDVEQVRPPVEADPARKTDTVGSNEPLWKNARTGQPVKYPGKHEVTSGVVVRDRQRENERAAANAGAGDAVEVDLFGNPTGVLGGARNSNDTVKAQRGPGGQQLGMFADDSRELTGQGALLDGLNPDAYDRPTPPPVVDVAPAVPADLTGLDDDHIADLVTKVGDEATLNRLLGELDRREGAERYRQVVDSVPDQQAIREAADEHLVDLMVQLTSVPHEPDSVALGRVEAELDRRDAEQRARFEAEENERLAAEQTIRDYIDQAIAAGSEDDLEAAARYASQLDDETRVLAVFAEWDRREKAEQARLDAAAATKAKADAERLAVEQQQARDAAAKVAAEQAERDALDAEFQAMYPSQVSAEFVQNAASVDPVKQARHAAAVRELDRRSKERADEDRRRKLVERRERISRGPVKTLSDAELGEAIAGIEADGLNSNTVRQNRLVDLREEKGVRDAEAARIAALKASTPTAPARLRNPIGALRHIKLYAEHDQGIRDRLVRARMSALGVPEPEITASNEWSAFKAREKARKSALAQAAKDDPRSAQEQAATIVAHYRHLAKIDNPTIRDGRLASEYERRAQFGPDDDPAAGDLVEAAPFEKIPKAYEVFQDIRRAAMQDRADGNPATAARAEKAYRRALGLPDDASNDEVRDAYGGDERSSGDLASQMIVEYRDLAEADGIDPDDRLRYGPKRKYNAAPTSAGYRTKPTPEQDAEVSRRVADGEDYIEAYASVYGLDPDAMRREEAAFAAGGGRIRGDAVATLKAAYEEHSQLQYLDAESATAGHLLNEKGKRSGKSPSELFSGPLSRVRPYASEELLRYWAENPRMTFAEFKANVTGGAKKARELASAGSSGRDFV